MDSRKRIALVAHDNKKSDLLEWVRFNRAALSLHELLATGTTGGLLEEELGIPVVKLQSGPLGGDQQIGAKISEGLIDFLISSPLMSTRYEQKLPNYDAYRGRLEKSATA